MRVQSIAALHDEVADKAWIDKWTFGGDWKVGLTTGLSDKAGEGLGSHVRALPLHLHIGRTAYTTIATTSCTPILRIPQYLHPLSSPPFRRIHPVLPPDPLRLLLTTIRRHPLPILHNLRLLLARQRT
jgi:hypothetical protein